MPDLSQAGRTLGITIHTIHGASAQAAAAALVMVNTSPEFVSPDRNKVNLSGRQPDIMPFKQPEGAASIVEKIAETGIST